LSTSACEGTQQWTTKTHSETSTQGSHRFALEPARHPRQALETQTDKSGPLAKLTAMGLIEIDDGVPVLTDAGLDAII
jgi:hypothetical protein